jgi:hypothetical protein
VISASDVVLTYRADQQGNGWVWRELRDHGTVTLSRVFTFERRDLVSEPDQGDKENDFEEFEYRFRFAARRSGYFHIEGRILNIDKSARFSSPSEISPFSGRSLIWLHPISPSSSVVAGKARFRFRTSKRF